jgi:uncharacterized protein (TIGR03086 family)
MTSTTSHTTKPDTRPLFATALATATQAVNAVRVDQLDRATDCGEYTVRELLGHMAMVLRRVAVVGQGLDPMTVTEDSVTGVVDSQWSGVWATEAAGATTAWAHGEQLGATIVFPWVTHSGADTLVMYAGELTTHTWDLAKATGQSVSWNDDVLRASLESIQRILPDPNRASTFEAARHQMPPEFRNFAPPFADAVAVADTAPLIDRLVAWTGRQP